MATNPFYLQISEWILEIHQRKKAQLLQLKQTASSLAPAPIVIGLQGPQGSGKSTLCHNLLNLLSSANLKAVSVSIDDFYLTHLDQTFLAKKYFHNPYLQQRGYPGTHDIPLGSDTLSQLKTLKDNESIMLPRYDKSKHSGRGDRAEVTARPQIFGPLDVILFEGWMLGFQPVEASQIRNRDLIAPNNFLKLYANWYSHLTAFIQLRAQDIQYVIDWRIEAEEKMKGTGKSGMSTGEVRKYIELFLPAYEIYLPTLERFALRFENRLTVEISKSRLPVKPNVSTRL